MTYSIYLLCVSESISAAYAFPYAYSRTSYAFTYAFDCYHLQCSLLRRLGCLLAACCFHCCCGCCCRCSLAAPWLISGCCCYCSPAALCLLCGSSDCPVAALWLLCSCFMAAVAANT